MRFVLKFAPFSIVLFLAAGCRPPQDSGPPNMMPQIVSALQMREARERDTALASACRESAEHRSAPAVLMGLPHIEDAALRDQVAQECATTLGESGESEAAVEIAKLISNEQKRDELLAKLTGE